METLENPYRRAISLLEASKIDYVIVGGFAVVMYGCNRFTPDLNVMVSYDDAERLRDFIGKIGETAFTSTTDPDPAVLLSKKHREELFDDGRRWFFSFKDVDAPSFSLDLFLGFPVPFQELYSRRTVLNAEEQLQFSICSLEDLIALKTLAGRGQDLADIEALRLIQKIEEMKAQGVPEAEIVAQGEGDAVQERVEGFLRFLELSPEERLRWLSEMLNNLAKFFMV